MHLCEIFVISNENFKELKNNKAEFLRNKNWLYKIGTKLSANYKYELFLKKLYPSIHRGFFQAYLNIVF